MIDPKEKDKHREGSPGRPGTKFLERPRFDSDEVQGTDQGQEHGLDVEEQAGDPHGESGKGEIPNPPDKKDEDKGPKKQSGQGGDVDTMGKEV